MASCMDHVVDLDSPELSGVPGKVEVVLAVFEPGHPDYERARRDLPTFTKVRQELGGDEGTMVDPALGLEHHISLVPYSNVDPDNTYLEVTFRFIPDQPIAPEHRHLFPPFAQQAGCGM